MRTTLPPNLAAKSEQPCARREVGACDPSNTKPISPDFVCQDANWMAACMQMGAERWLDFYKNVARFLRESMYCSG